MNFNFNLSAVVSAFKIAINTDDEDLIKINLIAILLVIVLADILKELIDEKEEMDEIGLEPLIDE